MAMTPTERKRRQRERSKAKLFQMEITETERHSIAQAASRMGYDDQTEYLLDLVYADLKRPAVRACNYPECNCPFDKPANGKCLKGYEEIAVTCHEYSHGVCADGAAILKDGQPMTVEEIVSELNQGRAASSESAEAVAWNSHAVDPIVSKLYRKFKEWSQRGFTADDVTWCEVRGYVAELLNTTTPTTWTDWLPDGYVLAPKSMCITQEDVGLIVMMTGWDDEGQDDAEGVLWFGLIEDDDGNRTHGLNISCSECMEEGAIQLVQFDEPRSTHPAKAQGVPEIPTEQMLEAAMSDRDRQNPANAKRYLRYVWERMLAEAPLSDKPEGECDSFQSRVQPWLMECFGATIAGDKDERNHRFLEEALELVQSLRCTAEEAHKLVDYVFSRPIGDPPQEVGGVKVTLAALCLANAMDMHKCGEAELARITQPEMVERIREKQKRKPSMSPLPGVYPDRPAAPDMGGD